MGGSQGGKGQQQMQQAGASTSGANMANTQAPTPWSSQQAWMSPPLGQGGGGGGMMGKGGQRPQQQGYQFDQSGAMGIENVQSGTPDAGVGYTGPAQGGGYAQVPPQLSDWLRNNGWSNSASGGAGAAAPEGSGAPAAGGTAPTTTAPAPAAPAPAPAAPGTPGYDRTASVDANKYGSYGRAADYSGQMDPNGRKNWETFRFNNPADNYGKNFNAIAEKYGPGAAYNWIQSAGGGQGRQALQQAWGGERGEINAFNNTMGLLSGPGQNDMGLSPEKLRELSAQVAKFRGFPAKRGA